jgi:hypothetical protein
MALSNVFREPRREITESLVGVAMTLIPFALATRWFYLRWANPDTWLTGATDKGTNLINSPFDLEGCAAKCAAVRTYLNLEVLLAALGAAAVVCLAIWLVIYFTHWAGEELCDQLANGGYEIRPRNRR